MPNRLFLASLLHFAFFLPACTQMTTPPATPASLQTTPPKVSAALGKQIDFQTPSSTTNSFETAPDDTIEQIQLRWADAAEPAEMIQKIFGITAINVHRSNALILSGNRTKVRVALQLASELDRGTDAEQFNVFFIYPLKNAKAIEMAALFQSLADKGLYFSDDMNPKTHLLVVPDPRTNSLLIATSTKYEDQLRDILKTLDKEIPK